MPCAEGADAAGSVISAESAPSEVLDVGGACWATLAAAAGASAEPVPPPEGTAKPRRKQCRRQEQILHGRDGNRRWLRRQLHERRISHEKQRGRQSSYVARVWENRRESD